LEYEVRKNFPNLIVAILLLYAQKPKVTPTNFPKFFLKGDAYRGKSQERVEKLMSFLFLLFHII
jgi:hypothetical protein